MGTFGFPADPYTTEGSWYESIPTRVRWSHEPGATASVLRRPADPPYRVSQGAAHPPARDAAVERETPRRMGRRDGRCVRCQQSLALLSVLVQRAEPPLRASPRSADWRRARRLGRPHGRAHRSSRVTGDVDTGSPRSARWPTRALPTACGVALGPGAACLAPLRALPRSADSARAHRLGRLCGR